MWANIISNIVLLIGGTATLSGALMAWRNRKRTDRVTDTKIELDEAQKQQIVQGTASQVEEDYLRRLGDFRAEIAAVRSDLSNERQIATEWRNRVLLLEDFFFTQHMPWDRRMTMLAREQGWEIEDPPSILEYLKKVSAQQGDPQ